MIPKSISSAAHEQAITVCLTSLHQRIAQLAERRQALGELDLTHQTAGAIGALAGLHPLLTEISVLYDAVLVLYRTAYVANPKRTTEKDSLSQRDVADVHKEVEELATIRVINPTRAALLRQRLTASIAEHLGNAMGVTQLVDLYNDLLSAEHAATSDSTREPTEAELSAEFERYCTREGLGDQCDAMALLHRESLTSEQRKWLSDFVRRWDTVLRRSDRGPAPTERPV